MSKHSSWLQELLDTVEYYAAVQKRMMVEATFLSLSSPEVAEAAQRISTLTEFSRNATTM